MAGPAASGGDFPSRRRRGYLDSSFFWTTSPAFFFLRAGLMTAGIAAAYAWESRPGGAERWSPLRQLGRTSLFIYWIHVEMIYGLISRPLHRSLTLAHASLAFAAFALFMLACSIAKDRVVRSWRTQSLAARASVLGARGPQNLEP